MPYDTDGNWYAVKVMEKGLPRKKGGKSPRDAGNRAERTIAKQVGGDRVPGSGSIKNTNHNLKGDIEVKDDMGRQFVKLEVKLSGAVTSKGEKTFPLTKKIVEQAKKEAEEVGEIGAVVIRYKGDPETEGLVVMPLDHFTKLLNLAKAGNTLDRQTYPPPPPPTDPLLSNFYESTNGNERS